jgi:hypothetical protein
MDLDTTTSVAFFISPHGYGHAARASAIMSALHGRNPSVRFEIFTTVPVRLFQESLTGPFNYHPLLTDIGLAQVSPLRQDMARTLELLDGFLPFRESQITALARRLGTLDCALVVCDIAPLGIAVARAAGLRSVLVENFTWDWIYQDCTDRSGRLGDHARYLASQFLDADYHIQMNPVCRPVACDLSTRPVSRRPVESREDIRSALGVPEQASLVLITMGGIQARHHFLERLTAALPEIIFVIPGAADTLEVRANLILLPHHSDFFHPDLINAADAVIGKVGYSTLAEVYWAGVPFGYVARPAFRESAVLVDYIGQHCRGIAINAEGFEKGLWLDTVPQLLDLPRIERRGGNGAVQAAAFIADQLKAGG